MEKNKAEKIETEKISLDSYKDMVKKMKEMEKVLKASPETAKELKDLKKKEAKVRPEKPEEYKALATKFQEFVRANLQEVEKLFLASVTTEKPDGQKWIIFNLGEKEKYGFGIINNSLKAKK